MKAAHAKFFSIFALGVFSLPVLGQVVIPRVFTGTSDSAYGRTPAKAVELAAVAAIQSAWTQLYGNCTLSGYSYQSRSTYYAASANVNCTKPGKYIPVVVIFTFSGATDPLFDNGIRTESSAIDTAVMRSEAAARAEGYSECVLKGYSTWKPSPPLEVWAASAVVDCKKSVSFI
ncbi:hypothetical protein [Xanthomonas cucurbitae]|uniref:Uncharacterized protein n=1 Tax=Xanthomonas cucurbitae TaxID=56453 RepID=A0ABY7YE53_9XANT|nr:hypothetical protein [Xanthomonas cucurbitae]WDM68290.1 hypothetical protein K6981_02895 [Xanthomonas cucurbitae]WDM72163.1 hypothetical protein K6978_02895 [Xanthomonas cucurbitae]